MTAVSIRLTQYSMGTPGYISPEQIEADPRKIGPATDIYGIGGVLFYLLTEAPPFDNSVNLMERIRTIPASPPSTLEPAVPRQLDAIVLRCLEKDPAERWESTDALKTALEEFLEEYALSNREAVRVCAPANRQG